MMHEYNKDNIIANLKAFLRANRETDKVYSIHSRSNNRGGLVRYKVDQNETLIIKLWRIRNIKEKIKSNIKVSNGHREWAIHKSLFNAGLKVPKPVVLFKFNDDNNTSWEAMIIEDLGKSNRGLPHLKGLVNEGLDEDVDVFENTIIEFTKNVLRLGFLDIDNQLNNFIITEENRLYRIDFECARKYRLNPRRSMVKAEMFARLITSHVFAVQPNVERTEQFVNKLYGSISLNKSIKKLIKNYVEKSLTYQYEAHGIKSEIVLPVK